MAGQGSPAEPAGPGQEQVALLQLSPWISGGTGLTCRLVGGGGGEGVSSFTEGTGGPGPCSRRESGWGWAGGKQRARARYMVRPLLTSRGKGSPCPFRGFKPHGLQT